MLTLEQACTGLGVALSDVLAHKVYPDRVVVVVKDGRKLTYTPTEGTQGTQGTQGTEGTQAATPPEQPAPERKRKGRGMSADISETKEAHDA